MANRKEKYDPQEVLLMGEVFKLIFSACVVAWELRCADGHDSVERRLLHLTLHSSKMFALAMIYGAMNILSYVAIRRVDAAVFTVCAQLKILTTAGFSVAILRRHLSYLKWRALLELVLGCILVTVPQLSSSSGDSADSMTSFCVGMLAVIMEVTLSGFASIYFEKVIKISDEKLSIWDRNYQLAMHSIFLYILYGVAQRRYAYQDTTQQYVPFHDFSCVAWTLAFLGGFGGILVALTVKLADSVVKTLAVSCAIVTSTLASHYILKSELDLEMIIGALVVTFSVVNYSFDPSPSLS